MKNYTFLSCLTDLGANIRGSARGSIEIRKEILNNHSQDKFKDFSSIKTNPEKHLKEIITNCSIEFQESLNKGEFPILLGGDHSCAMASIYAASQFCKKNKKELYVFWFDAHADINTTETSETGNIHGMPVAMLSGLDKTGRIIPPGNHLKLDNFYLFGARSIDKAEKDILKYNNVKFAHDYQKSENILKNAIKNAPTNAYFHISFDVDCLDPKIASGVSTPEENGFTVEEGLKLISVISNDSRFSSLDVVEYNPLYDNKEKQTLSAIKKLFELVFKQQN